MGVAFLHGNGGGGSNLNFEVKDYRSEDSRPSTEKENAIAVITNTDVTSWVFSATEPENPEEDMVWFEISSTSDVTFNALKKNALIVRLSRAYQYINGAFIPLSACIYDGTSWIDFSSTATYLYFEGNSYEGVTGGYVAAGMKASSGDGGFDPPNIAETGSNMVISPYKPTSAGSYIGGIVRTNLKIDCAKYDSLIFEGTVDGIGQSVGNISLWSDMGTNQDDNRVKSVSLANGSDPIIVDISELSDSYYIGFGFNSTYYGQITVTMTSFRLE